jgi:2-hydroxychromene-2-carboxylate isomerase
VVDFLFDYISSNAYLAWVKLLRMEGELGFTTRPVPVLFAGLLEAHGQLGPAEIRPKAMWMAANNLRKAALLGVPLRPPAFHPFNPLLALRVSGLPMAEDRRRALVGALLEAFWARELHVMDPEVVARVASEQGLDGPRLVAEAGQPEAKARLRAETDSAIARGVFGVPTMLVEGQLFWGFDDLPYLEMLLAGRDPLVRSDLAHWSRPPRPAAVRRRFREGA